MLLTPTKKNLCQSVRLLNTFITNLWLVFTVECVICERGINFAEQTYAIPTTLLPSSTETKHEITAQLPQRMLFDFAFSQTRQWRKLGDYMEVRRVRVWHLAFLYQFTYIIECRSRISIT